MSGNKRRTLFVEIDSCTGCRACMEACSLTQEGFIDVTRSRLWVPRFEDSCLGFPMICEQCESAPCANICPTHAIVRDVKTGAYLVNSSRCIGCKECIWVCPFGVITLGDRGVAIKCNYCDGEPMCAKVCLPGALKWVDIDDPRYRRRWRAVEKRLSGMTSPAYQIEV